MLVKSREIISPHSVVRNITHEHRSFDIELYKDICEMFTIRRTIMFVWHEKLKMKMWNRQATPTDFFFYLDAYDGFFFRTAIWLDYPHQVL